MFLILENQRPIFVVQDEAVATQILNRIRTAQEKEWERSQREEALRLSHFCRLISEAGLPISATSRGLLSARATSMALNEISTLFPEAHRTVTLNIDGEVTHFRPMRFETYEMLAVPLAKHPE